MADKTTRTLHSLNWNGEVMKLKFSVDGKNEEPDEFQMKSCDPPRKELQEALNDLRKHAGEILDIFDDEWTKGIDIRGAIFGWQHGKMGAKINCVRTLNNGRKFCFLTPYMTTGDVDAEEDTTPEQLFTEAAVKALEKVLAEGFLYIDGNRAQGNLFDQAA